jgi:diguanylate cyclase (GGDEF)-like protein/PAS domain S-box-containing protein
LGLRNPLDTNDTSRARGFDTLRLLAAALDAVRFGVMAVDSSGEVVACNAAARQLLDLSIEDGGSTQLSKILASLSESGVSVLETGGARLRNRNGALVEIQATPLSGGLALVVEDVSDREERSWDNQIRVAEYESLFTNAVCGIYRDQLDGTPVRCNPALAALNGYGSESEYVTAVTGTGADWYVDEDRLKEFRRLMREEGRVKDLVSEVYRHGTRERFWITENAWYVRDPDGDPLYIEGTIQDATERVAALELVERQANVDSLTLVASRFRFFSALPRMTSDGCTLYCIDLDGFKEVNDRLGHAAGDQVLVACAQRITSLAGHTALVARLGGDEFAVLIPGKTLESDALHLAAKLVSAISEAISAGGREVTVGASVGIARGDAGSNGERLLHEADLALYKAKETGRNRFCFYDQHVGDGVERRKVVEQELRRAIDQGQFALHYQPIVDTKSGEILAMEALLRWKHPERGLLKPEAFVADAEAGGLMTELSRWALKTACTEASGLPPDVGVSVNLSAGHFLHLDVVDDIVDALQSSGLDARRLTIEITDSAIVNAEAKATKALTALKTLGVASALDDFGTSFSSLGYLQRFQFDAVKVDCSYVAGIVSNPASTAILRGLANIGRDVGMDVIAEGAETQELADAVAAAGCVKAQGYFFGQPKPFTEVASDLAVTKLATQLTQARDFGERLVEALKAS